MKKNIRFILCCLLLSISLAGCAPGDDVVRNDKGYQVVSIGNRNFVKIETGESDSYFDYAFIYVDIETNVQYLLVDGYNMCAMEVIVDADGKPILYEGEID